MHSTHVLVCYFKTVRLDDDGALVRMPNNVYVSNKGGYIYIYICTKDYTIFDTLKLRKQIAYNTCVCVHCIKYVIYCEQNHLMRVFVCRGPPFLVTIFHCRYIQINYDCCFVFSTNEFYIID